MYIRNTPAASQSLRIKYKFLSMADEAPWDASSNPGLQPYLPLTHVAAASPGSLQFLMPPTLMPTQSLCTCGSFCKNVHSRHIYRKALSSLLWLKYPFFKEKFP